MTTPLPLAIVGCDYRNTSTRWRAAAQLDAQQREHLMVSLRGQSGIGFVQLSTCNRTDWIIHAQSPDWAAQLLQAQLQQRWDALAEDGIAKQVKPQTWIGGDALDHLFRVGVGLESFVVGERQVAGQLHKAFLLARNDGHSSGFLNMLQTTVGRLVARVGRIEGYGVDAEGIHTVIGQILSRQIDSGARVLVIGTGEIGQAIANRLKYLQFDVIVANRTPRESADLSLASVRGQHLDVAAVVVATGSPTPVWGDDDLCESVRGGDRQLLVIDVGSPAQTNITATPGVNLIDLDAVLTGSRPPIDAGVITAVEYLVTDAKHDFKERLCRQSMAPIRQISQNALETLYRNELPDCIDRHAQALPRRQRTVLEAELRGLIHGYGQTLLAAMEPDTEETI